MIAWQFCRCFGWSACSLQDHTPNSSNIFRRYASWLLSWAEIINQCSAILKCLHQYLFPNTCFDILFSQVWNKTIHMHYSPKSIIVSFAIMQQTTVGKHLHEINVTSWDTSLWGMYEVPSDGIFLCAISWAFHKFWWLLGSFSRMVGSLQYNTMAVKKFFYCFN